MAIYLRSTVFNTLDVGPGTTEYSPGGGNAAFSINTTDNFQLEGAGCAAERLDNSSLNKGFGSSTNANVDLSETNTHACYWFGTSVWNAVSSYSALIYAGGEGTVSVPSTYFPGTFGYIPIWVDTTQFDGVVTNYDSTAVEAIGAQITVGEAGSGNARNTFFDMSSYCLGQTDVGVYSIDGSTTIENLRTEETGDGVNEGYFGLLVFKDGVDYIYSRLVIGENATAGTASATTFSASDKTFIFVDQPGISTTFLGWTVNLGATGSFSLTNCNYQSSSVSSASRRPDLIFSGTTASASLNSCAILGARQVTLTSSCTVDGGTFDAVSTTQAGAEIKNCVIRPRSASGVAMITDATFGSTSGIHDCTITNVGSGHAFEFTAADYTGSPNTITFTNIEFSNSTFGANGSANAAIRNTSGQPITINLSGTSNTPTVTNVGAGSSITFVNSKTLTVTNIQPNTELRIYSYTDIESPGTYVEEAGVELAASPPTSSTFDSIVEESDGTITATYTYDASGGNIPVRVVAHNTAYNYFSTDINLLASENTSLQLFQISDRNYNDDTPPTS